MPTTRPSRPSSAREDYLKALYRLQRGGRRVQTTEMARALGVRKPSVTGMLKRLAEEGLVDYGPGAGARLTRRGLLATVNVIRRHRLIETFLVEVLGLDWSEVHDEAEILEHHLSEKLVEAMERTLGYPTEDPHGQPIPDADGNLRQRDLIALGELKEGESAFVRECRAENRARLCRWKELGLVPGAKVRLLEVQRLDDVWRFAVAGETVITGSEGIEGIYVERCDEQKA